MRILHPPSFILCLLLLSSFLLPLSSLTNEAHAGIFGRRPKPSMTIVSDTTLVPGTTYYFPSGLAANEESWLNNGAFKEAPSLFSYGLDCDSVTGYDSGCVVTITAIFGYESETDSTEFLYGDDNVAAGWIVWSDSVQTLCRTDKGRLINCGLPLHERRRYTITVTDTVHIDSFRETPAKP